MAVLSPTDSVPECPAATSASDPVPTNGPPTVANPPRRVSVSAPVAVLLTLTTCAATASPTWTMPNAADGVTEATAVA